MWCTRRSRVQSLPRKPQMGKNACDVQVRRLVGKFVLFCCFVSDLFFFFFEFICNPLSHRITNYTPDLKKKDVDSAIHNALKVWSNVTPLKFKKLHEGTADIMIGFGRLGRLTSREFCSITEMLFHSQTFFFF